MKKFLVFSFLGIFCCEGCLMTVQASRSLLEADSTFFANHNQEFWEKSHEHRHFISDYPNCPISREDWEYYLKIVPVLGQDYFESRLTKLSQLRTVPLKELKNILDSLNGVLGRIDILIKRLLPILGGLVAERRFSQSYQDYPSVLFPNIYLASRSPNGYYPYLFCLDELETTTSSFIPTDVEKLLDIERSSAIKERIKLFLDYKNENFMPQLQNFLNENIEKIYVVSPQEDEQIFLVCPLKKPQNIITWTIPLSPNDSKKINQAQGRTLIVSQGLKYCMTARIVPDSADNILQNYRKLQSINVEDKCFTECLQTIDFDRLCRLLNNVPTCSLFDRDSEQDKQHFCQEITQAILSALNNHFWEFFCLFVQLPLNKFSKAEYQQIEKKNYDVFRKLGGEKTSSNLYDFENMQESFCTAPSVCTDEINQYVSFLISTKQLAKSKRLNQTQELTDNANHAYFISEPTLLLDILAPKHFAECAINESTKKSSFIFSKEAFLSLDKIEYFQVFKKNVENNDKINNNIKDCLSKLILLKGKQKRLTTLLRMLNELKNKNEVGIDQNIQEIFVNKDRILKIHKEIDDFAKQIMLNKKGQSEQYQTQTIFLDLNFDQSFKLKKFLGYSHGNQVYVASLLNSVPVLNVLEAVEGEGVYNWSCNYTNQIKLVKTEDGQIISCYPFLTYQQAQSGLRVDDVVKTLKCFQSNLQDSNKDQNFDLLCIANQVVRNSSLDLSAVETWLNEKNQKRPAQIPASQNPSQKKKKKVKDYSEMIQKTPSVKQKLPQKKK